MSVTAPDAVLVPCYQFAGVVLDPTGHRLRVDGRDRACSRRALALLELLCQRPGRVWPRTELLDALWPGGQIVADESLSQLVFRLRAALGRHGERVVTVRGVGVRLDADVAAGDADIDPDTLLVPITPEPRTDPAPQPAPVPTAPAPAPISTPPASAASDLTRWPRRTVIIGLGLGLAVALIVGWLVFAPLLAGGDPTRHMVDEGYGLHSDDLLAQRGDSARLITSALHYDDRSDRERARALLEAVFASDPATPVPALLLALWDTGIGDDAGADQWLQRGVERMPTQPQDPYLPLLERYVRAEVTDSPSEVIRQAGALLDLRPQAWRFRLARAHLYGYMGLRDQALTELQQIQVGRLDHSRQTMALGDRASFGDVDGARRVLDTLPGDPDNANEAFVRGRIEWSAGDHRAARAHLERAANLARRSAQLGLRDRALAYAGILALLDDELDAAIVHLERARAGAVERGIGNLEIDLGLLLAHAQRERGDETTMRAELARARDRAERHRGSTLAFATVLATARLAPDLQPDIEAATELPGAMALIGARRAMLAGDRTQANILLDQAIAQGALDAWLAEETRWLLVELGRPAPAGPPLDPPHPPLARYAIRRQVEQVLARGPGSFSTRD